MGTIAPPRPRARPRRRSASASVTAAHLGRYEDRRTGALREIVSLPADNGSHLLVDRVAATSDDARLVAHLGADEPRENERRLCGMYLADPRRGTCRHLEDDDFEKTAFSGPSIDEQGGSSMQAAIVGADGFSYAIGQLPSESGLELRWTRCRLPDGVAEPVTLRQVIGHFEGYEPMRAITNRALAAATSEPGVSTVTLGAELARLNTSRVVLNRGLREAVARMVGRGELTLSDIAIRCGRIKRDARGNVSGETSWLARRIGQLPESRASAPTAWVHSDVLALIAREGLGLCPHEVEL